MTNAPKIKLTFKSLADDIGCSEKEVKDLLISKNLAPENLTQPQIDSIKSKLSKGIAMNTQESTLTPIAPKANLALGGDSPTITDIDLDDLDNMTLEQILEANQKSEDDAKRLEALAIYRANQKRLIELKEKNLAGALETKASKASYELRLESQSELMELNIEKAKLIQTDITQREIKALNNTVTLAKTTPTPMEIREGEAKKLQAMGQNRLTIVGNSTPDLVPQMRLTSGTESTPDVQTLEAVVN